MKFIDHRLVFSIFLLIISKFESQLCVNGEENLFSVSSSDCGGRFSGHQYLITSPNYPKNYTSNLDCVYDLIGIDSAQCQRQIFHLQFLEFQLEDSENCSKDYISIGNEVFYCGDSIGIRRFNADEKNILKLLFHSDDKNTNGKGFKILVSTIPCNKRKPDASIDSELTTIIGDTIFDSQPIYHPENIEFGNEESTVDETGLNSATRKLHKVSSKLPEGLKRPAERLELPIFGKQNFHDQNYAENVAISGLQGSLSPPKVTSYLYLPPKSNSENSKVSSSGKNSSSEEIVRRPENGVESFLPSRENPRETMNKWLIYGVPNSPIPSIGNFDPLANIPSQNCPGRGNGEGNSPGHVYPSNGNFGSGQEDWDPSFEVEGSNREPLPGFANYYPAIIPSSSFGIDESTYDIFGNTLSECCNGAIYSSQTFLLVSPAFPSLISTSTNYECGYTVQRASSSICQLNVNFKFFNFGSEDRFCAYGYLEIDGKRYCGCQTGVNVTTNFNNIATKIITVKYSGYPKGKFAGFLLEVSQQSCSTDYIRNNGNNFLRNFEWQLKNVNGETNIRRDPSAMIKTNYRQQTTRRDVGYFNQRSSITGENLILGSCRIFKFLNWVKAAKQVWQNSARCSSSTASSQISAGISLPTKTVVSVIPVFPEYSDSLQIFSANNPASQNCEFVNIVEGTLSSLYYPTNYPNDTNQCFRFAKAPGYCQLELAMLDFDLENSTLCAKDYVSFAGLKRRYCGTSLAGSRTIFDFTRSSYADMYFVTDSSGSGRGFRAGFSQISCSG